MESVWLSEIGCSTQSSKMTFSRSSPCLGVFTDEPRKIARRLARPKTPFVPAPSQTLNDGFKWAESAPSAENFADSPPVAFDGGFTEPEDGLSFF
jgi:hypothetical protein